MPGRAAAPAGCGQLEDERAAGLGRRARPNHPGARELTRVEIMVCPPATLLAGFAAAAAGSPVRVGAQDCHAEPAGAFTGDLSAEMLQDAGATRRHRGALGAPHLS